MDGLLSLIIPAGIAIFAIFCIGVVSMSVYNRTTKSVAIIRTGAGGQKVVKDNGIFVFPVLHEATKVFLTTHKIDVSRTGADALITKDKLRVDIAVAFFIRVRRDDAGIAAAAESLGPTKDEGAAKEVIRKLIEDKATDGLRTVAAQMTLDDLHEQRAEFSQRVQQAIEEELRKNGLELETASVTTLDQTPMNKLDTSNVFNAEGLRAAAERIAKSREERARIEAEADVKVAVTERERELRKLDVQRDTEQAAIEQQRSIEEARAVADAEIAKRRAEAARATEEAEIEKIKAIEIAQVARQVAIANKSQEESTARKAADEARAAAVAAAESVKTASAVAEAERAKRIALLKAEEEAEREATEVRVRARAERDAAHDYASARTAKARADADAAKLAAEATEAQGLAEASAKKALAEAENGLSKDVIDLRVRLAAIEAMPGVVEQMVRPADKIDKITIHNVTGLGSGGQVGPNSGGAAASVSDAITSMALTLPMVTELGRQAGINVNDGIRGLFAAHGDEAE